ncbi:MAG: hypothetical protein IT581_08045 [Verrucomicrobiales bacterium]|nr:hypothetical protein [Verrucomicrobiales bacterium]
MRGLRLTALTLALALSLGLDWAALQTIAWTRMLTGFSQSMSIGQALTQTFDGLHPCTLCLAIRRAKAAEQRSSSPAIEKTQVKLEFDVPLDLAFSFLIVPPLTPIPWLGVVTDHPQAPPKPRPRDPQVA